MMQAPPSTPELRSSGKNVYFFAALAFAVEAFGIALKGSSGLPLDFPEGFAISGALGLILIAISVPLFVQLIRQLFVGIDAHLLAGLKLEQDADKIRNELLKMAKYKPSVKAGSDSNSFLLDWNPTVINIFGWASFVIEAVLPLIVSISVIIYCSSSISSVLSEQHTEREVTEICEIQAAFLSGLESNGGEEMTALKSEFTAEEETLERRINPDGSVGGYVSSLATVPKSVIVPFSSMICRGAVLSEGQTISDGVYIDADNIEKPSIVTRIGEIEVIPNI
ncbi:MAG: hypothetical protein AAFQ87_25500 [Bacteroidota bacterium]